MFWDVFVENRKMLSLRQEGLEGCRLEAIVASVAPHVEAIYRISF